MLKIVVDVEGMMCGMCESHINDAIRREFQVKKVASSCRKKQTIIIGDIPEEEVNDRLKEVIERTGYQVKGIRSESYKKKGLFW